MKNIRQVAFNTVTDLFEEDRKFVVRVHKDNKQIMLFSDNCMENGRTIINFVKALQDNDVIAYNIQTMLDDSYEIDIIVK